MTVLGGAGVPGHAGGRQRPGHRPHPDRAPAADGRGDPRRRAPRWFVLTGLIHDLGKVLCLFGEPQWAVVGDTFPVGCRWSATDRLPRVLRRQPGHAQVPKYQTAVRRLRRGLRARQRAPVLGPRRVPLPRRQGPPAAPALYMIRYHSFYPWHREGEYDAPAERAATARCSTGCGRSTRTTCTPRARCGPTGRRCGRTTRSWSHEFFPDPLRW